MHATSSWLAFDSAATILPLSEQVVIGELIPVDELEPWIDMWGWGELCQYQDHVLWWKRWEGAAGSVGRPMNNGFVEVRCLSSELCSAADFTLGELEMLVSIKWLLE